MAVLRATEPWIKLPPMPPVTNVFLPTAPAPKTSVEVDFAFSLAPCIRKGHEKNAEPLLAALTEARKSALASLDPSRTIASAEMVSADARKYLVLLKGFREAAREAPAPATAGAAAAAADELPSADVAVKGSAAEEAAEAEKKAKAAEELKSKALAEAKAAAADKKPKTDWLGRPVKPPPAPEAIEGSSETDGGAANNDDAPIPALPMGDDGKAIGGGGGENGETTAPGAVKTKKKPKKQYEATSPPVVDGTLRHMCAFVWRDLGDDEGCMFRLGDTVLEEASVLFALAQVLLQKAKAEPLNDLSALDVFKWLKQSSGVLACAIETVKESGPAPSDQTPDDLKNGLLNVLVDCSLAQAQHITVRRAMVTMRENKAITHTLLARLCNDTAERYKAMEPSARGLCEKGAQQEGVGAYVMAHLRYKQLYFMGMAYSMVGLDRCSSDPENLGYGIRDLMTAKDLFDKAELAAKKFIEAARSIVYVDNLTILHGLNDCQQAATDILDKATKENDSVYYKVVPEKPDALPERMSNLSADSFELAQSTNSPLWTEAAYAAFDPYKAPPLRLGKIPEVVDCCPTS